jgi:hypothetical protein
LCAITKPLLSTAIRFSKEKPVQNVCKNTEKTSLVKRV